MPPAPSDLGGPVVEVAGAENPNFFCARRADGAVLCWGDGRGEVWDDSDYGVQFYTGHLGPSPARSQYEWVFSDYFVGDMPGEMPPTPLPLGENPSTTISLGNGSACAAMNDGSLRCWGRALEGWPSLGYGSQFVRAYPEHFSPPPVNIGVSVADVAHTYDRTCVLGVDQFVRCFGRSEYGLLGQASSGPIASGDTIDSPPITELGGPVAQITDGRGGLCALGTDGNVRCFGAWFSMGYDTLEVVGDDAGEMPPPPIDLGGTEVASVVTSTSQMCALSTEGGLQCWGGAPTTYGYGAPNEVIGDEPGEMPPPPLELGGAVLNVFASKHANTLCAVLEDHSVVCWGRRVAGLGSGNTFDYIGDEPSEVPPPTLRLYD